MAFLSHGLSARRVPRPLPRPRGGASLTAGGRSWRSPGSKQPPPGAGCLPGRFELGRQLREPERLRDREPDREPLLDDREPFVERARVREPDRELAFGFARDPLLELVRLRELELRRREPVVGRWSLGTSARATAFASCGMRPSRYFAMRSSSRRMARATFAVSRSPTASAKASIAV